MPELLLSSVKGLELRRAEAGSWRRTGGGLRARGAGAASAIAAAALHRSGEWLRRCGAKAAGCSGLRSPHLTFHSRSQWQTASSASPRHHVRTQRRSADPSLISGSESRKSASSTSKLGHSLVQLSPSFPPSLGWPGHACPAPLSSYISRVSSFTTR